MRAVAKAAPVTPATTFLPSAAAAAALGADDGRGPLTAHSQYSPPPCVCARWSVSASLLRHLRQGSLQYLREEEDALSNCAAAAAARRSLVPNRGRNCVPPSGGLKAPARGQAAPNASPPFPASLCLRQESQYCFLGSQSSPSRPRGSSGIIQQSAAQRSAGQGRWAAREGERFGFKVAPARRLFFSRIYRPTPPVTLEKRSR